MNPTSGAGAGLRTDDAHQLFRGAAELTKRVRQGATCAELVAAVVAAWSSALAQPLWGGWASLAMAVLMMLAVALRIFARHTHSYSERCRRVSVRSYALGVPIGAGTHSGLVSDAPPMARRLASSLPATDLDAYYEPLADAGDARLREIYAHSSFYSWRLLRVSGWTRLSAGVVFALVGAFIVFGLALPSSTVATADKVLDIVCSIVFVSLAARALETASEALMAAVEARAVADSLLKTRDEDQVQELINHYDMERAAGSSVSTLAYKMLRDRLQAEWKQRRQALDELKGAPGMAPT